MNQKHLEMKNRMPVHARRVNNARSWVEQVYIMQTRLPRSNRILQISSMRKSSRTCEVKLGVFHNPGSSVVSGEWTAFGVDGTYDFGCDWRGLMILPDWPSKQVSFETDGPEPYNFSDPREQLGDYGCFTDSKEFRREGNLFTDVELLSMADIRKYKLSFRSWRASHWPDFNDRGKLHNSQIQS
ncbi:hypothetical protein SCLCIDRAFT_1225045, partial [Scleroderma citrinum Foug A]